MLIGLILYTNRNSAILIKRRFITCLFIFQNDITFDANVNIKVYDMLGRETVVLVELIPKAGNYEALFNASPFSSGVYFYKLITGDFSDTKKMILNK